MKAPDLPEVESRRLYFSPTWEQEDVFTELSIPLGMSSYKGVTYNTTSHTVFLLLHAVSLYLQKLAVSENSIKNFKTKRN